MGNIYKFPVTILDTFSSAIDIGSTLSGNSSANLCIEHIEWQEPTAVDDTAVITDGGGVTTLFDETCKNAAVSILKPFNGAWVSGLKIGISGVTSGKIAILFR